MEYIIHVKGMESAPQGSKKHVGNGIMVETSKRLKSWRNQVNLRAKLIVDDIIKEPVDRGGVLVQTPETSLSP